MASPLVIREPHLVTTAKPSLVPVAAKGSGITAAIARIASGRPAS